VEAIRIALIIVLVLVRRVHSRICVAATINPLNAGCRVYTTSKHVQKRNTSGWNWKVI